MNTESVPVARISRSDFSGESMDNKSVYSLDECEIVNPERKEEITGAVYYCMELLEKMDIFNKMRSTVISNRSKMMGQKMVKEVMNVIHRGEFVEETELLTAKEECVSHTEIASINIESAIEKSPSSPEMSEDEPKRDSVSFELKVLPQGMHRILFK